MSGDKNPANRAALEDKVASQLNLEVSELRQAQFSEEKLQTIFNKAQRNQENDEVTNLACTLAFGLGVVALLSSMAINDDDAQWAMIGTGMTAMLSAFGINTQPNKNYKKTIEQDIQSAISNKKPPQAKP